MGCRKLHFQLLVQGNLRALDRRFPVLLERFMQVGPARAERGFGLCTPWDAPCCKAPPSTWRRPQGGRGAAFLQPLQLQFVGWSDAVESTGSS